MCPHSSPCSSSTLKALKEVAFAHKRVLLPNKVIVIVIVVIVIVVVIVAPAVVIRSGRGGDYGST